MNPVKLAISRLENTIGSPTKGTLTPAKIVFAGAEIISTTGKTAFPNSKNISTAAKIISAATKTVSANAEMIPASFIVSLTGRQVIHWGTLLIMVSRVWLILGAMLFLGPAIGSSVAVAQNCRPWTNASGATTQFTWSNGQTCGAAVLGDPVPVAAGLRFTPTGYSIQASTPGFTYSVSSSMNYLTGGCCGGAATAAFGTVTIPPQGGRFRAGAGITATQAACCGRCDYVSVSAVASVDITQPGTWIWAYSAPAYFDVYGRHGWASLMQVSETTFMSLTINGGVGVAQVGGIDATPRVSCVADVDDSTGIGTPDGGVGIEDLLYYLVIYDVGATRADVDNGTGTGTPDGGVGIDDLLYYLARYDAGC